MNDVVIGKGNLDGKAIYAARDFRKGEIIIQYNLKSITEEEFNDLPDSEKQFVHIHHGIKHLYSEPERYVNHSNDPNTYQDLKNHCDIALSDILAGDEITTDSTKDDI